MIASTIVPPSAPAIVNKCPSVQKQSGDYQCAGVNPQGLMRTIPVVRQHDCHRQKCQQERYDGAFKPAVSIKANAKKKKEFRSGKAPAETQSLFQIAKARGIITRNPNPTRSCETTPAVRAMSSSEGPKIENLRKNCRKIPAVSPFCLKMCRTKSIKKHPIVWPVRLSGSQTGVPPAFRLAGYSLNFFELVQKTLKHVLQVGVAGLADGIELHQIKPTLPHFQTADQIAFPSKPRGQLGAG
jgi:hypothetical protein